MNIAVLAFDPADKRPRYRQLCDALAAAIGRGDLMPGARLPSERDLAAALGLSRTTVVNAYRELEAGGLVRGHVGRGTFVCPPESPDPIPAVWRGKVALAAERVGDTALQDLVRQPAPQTISFVPGQAALDQFPLDQFRELSDTILGRDPAALSLGPTEGQPALRRALAARYSVRPEEVLITAGAQQGIDLLARCLLDPGDTVVIDRPGYIGAIQPFRAAGARIVGWSIVDGALDELEDALLRYRPKFLYTNPTFHNPTGQTLSLVDRHALLELAARYRLPIIEDATYQDLYFGDPPPPTLREIDPHGQVITVNTFSKTFAPGLRLGWVLAPAAVIEQLALIKARADVFSPGLTQLIVADFLTSRRYDGHLRVLRAEHSHRHDRFLETLRQEVPHGALFATAAKGGLYLWCGLGEGGDAKGLLSVAADHGVLFVPGEQFYADGGGKRELRLCFSGATADRIKVGVRRLAAALAAWQAQPRVEGLGRQPLV